MSSASAGGQTQLSLSNQPIKLNCFLTGKKKFTCFFPFNETVRWWPPLYSCALTLRWVGVGGGRGGLAGADTGDYDTARLDFLPESPGCFAFLGISSLRFEFLIVLLFATCSHTLGQCI